LLWIAFLEETLQAIWTRKVNSATPMFDSRENYHVER